MNSSKKLKGFGINVELYHKDRKSLDIYINSLVELKVEWIRLMFDFLHPIEINIYEYFIDKCIKNNIKILGLLINNVYGLISNVFFPQFFNTPIYEEQQKYYSFVRYIVKTYSKKILYWQILNEVNTVRFWTNDPNPQEYILLLKKTRKIIRSIDEHAHIFFGALVGNDSNVLLPSQKAHFFKESMMIGAEDYFDIVSFHPYFYDCYFSLRNKEHYLKMIKKNIDIILQVRDTHKKPVWITEFGISPRWVRIHPKEIACIYWEAYKLCRKNEIPFFLWQLTDTRRHIYLPGMPEKYFGLLDEELKPKKVYNELVKLEK